MGTPEHANLEHRLNSIRAVIQSFESDFPAASPFAKPDIELLIQFFRDAEQNARNEIELHELVHSEIDKGKQACAHPERHVTNAPPPPSVIGAGTGPRLSRSREEIIAEKKEKLELELRKVEARAFELKKTIDDWYLRKLPEWDKATADAIARWTSRQQLVIEQYGALKSRCEGALSSLSLQPTETQKDRVTVAKPEDTSDRPFLWSEIHSIAKERIAQLDATLRIEIGNPKVRIPEHGAERRQFFLLLEEKANSWATVRRKPMRLA
jgi:hypothetical protein